MQPNTREIRHGNVMTRMMASLNFVALYQRPPSLHVVRRTVFSIQMQSLSLQTICKRSITVPTRSRSVALAPSTPRFNARTMASAPERDSGQLKIESTNIQTAAGVTLSDEQKTLVGSVLDLFAGRPSLAKLQLWKDEGEFSDPLTIAKGRKQYEAQWYGLQTAFSEIERLSHEVKDGGNPIVMDLKTRYVVKGIGKEQTINSLINIYHEGGKITKVEDKWDGKLPESGIAQVREDALMLMNPFWWAHYVMGWLFWCWSFTWETTAWKVSDGFPLPAPHRQQCTSPNRFAAPPHHLDDGSSKRTIC